MKYVISQREIDYSGRELRSGWICETFGVEGDAIAAFVGGCDVDPAFMVDLEDLEAGEEIFSRKMLHFIVEHTSSTPTEIVARQRLLVVIIKEVLEEMVPLLRIRRVGDDLFDGGFKLTVSIATMGGGGKIGLIHTGINIDPKGAPVPAKGLMDYGIEPDRFAGLVAERYVEEVLSIGHASRKVRHVQ